MAEQDETPTTISVEAHERVKGERDTLKSQVTELSQVARDAGRVNRAYEHFRAQEGFQGDPYGVASSAMRDINVRAAEDDKFTGALDAWLTNQTSMFGAPSGAPPPAVEGEEGEAPAESATPNVAGPSPNAPGQAAGQTREVLNGQSPEVVKMKERGDFEGIKKGIKEGWIVLKGDHYKRIMGQSRSA